MCVAEESRDVGLINCKILQIRCANFFICRMSRLFYKSFGGSTFLHAEFRESGLKHSRIVYGGGKILCLTCLVKQWQWQMKKWKLYRYV